MRFHEIDAGCRRPLPTLCFFLLTEQGDPLDPVAFITAVHKWSVGDTFPLGSGERFRIIEIETEIAQELIDAGFNGVFVIEPV
jgi:hypothetical protein